MASKIKVDNITDQDDNAVISRCGSTHTVTAEVYKADTIKDTSNNTYIAKCGTTLTIGGCGQTLALAAGTTNELGGGGVDWQTTPKTADFNASAGEGYFVDTSSNAVTVTLPTGVAGESVTVLDYVSNANTNAIIITPQSGEKIEGGTSGQGVTANRQATTLTYSGATQGWLVSSAGDSGPIVTPTITFTTASGSLGTISGPTERADPNGNLSPVTGTASFGTVSYSIQSGSLPGGLTLNSSTGAFVGTATEVGSDTTSNFTVRITITETGTTSDRSFSITVGPDREYISASGGTISTTGDFKIHKFTGPGTFTVSAVGNAAGSNTVDYMVVAGGGGGHTSGPGGAGGAGGAGGFRTSSGAASGCYPTSPLGSGVSALPVSVQGYPITVGGGGNGAPVQNSSANPGSSSSFSSITSAGGGRGSGHPGSGQAGTGASGGSGGGGGNDGVGTGGGGTGNSPPVSPPQGNPGGGKPPGTTGGGGGGAGSAGGTNSAGSGTPSSITASNVTYSEGGTGCPSPAASGPSNSGDGGGGRNGQFSSGGSGGSGIVVIRYKFQN